MSNNVRHKVFISYHHADQDEANNFVTTFSDERNVFIARALGVDMEQSIIDSTNTDYVMKRIRELYLKDGSSLFRVGNGIRPHPQVTEFQEVQIVT